MFDHGLIGNFKNALSGLRRFSATWSPLKVMKNSFYFILKILFFLKIFKFLFWLFAHVGKRLDLKDKVIFKLHDSTTWETNNCNIHIAQYIKKQMQLGQLIECNMRNIFLEKSYTKCGWETIPRPFSNKSK